MNNWKVFLFLKSGGAASSFIAFFYSLRSISRIVEDVGVDWVSSITCLIGLGVGRAVKSIGEYGDNKEIENEGDKQGNAALDHVVPVGLRHGLLRASVHPNNTYPDL